MLCPICPHPYTSHLAHPALLPAAPTPHTLHPALYVVPTRPSQLHHLPLSIRPACCTPTPARSDTPCTHRHAHPRLAREHTLPLHTPPLRVALGRGQPHGVHGTHGGLPAQHPCATPVSPASPTDEEKCQLLQHLLRLPLRDGRCGLCHGSPAVLLNLPGDHPPVVRRHSVDVHVSLTRGGRALPWHAHVLHHPGCHRHKPIPLPACSPGASTTHRCPLLPTCVCLSLTHCSSIMMTLFAIICLSLIEPWIPYAPQAQHAPWCQVRLQGMEHLTSLGGGCRTWLDPKHRSGGQPHVSMLCMSWSHHAWHTRAWGGSIAAHTPLPVPEALVTPSSTDLPPPAPSPQPHHRAQAHPMWGQDNSVAPSCCGAGCHHPRAAPQWHMRLSPLQPTALSPPCASRTGRACDLLAPTCPGTWRR